MSPAGFDELPTRMKKHWFELPEPPRELSWSLCTTVVRGGRMTVFAGAMLALYSWSYAGLFLS